MHRPIFGRSFAVLVAPVLLSVLAFKFLNKKKTSARRNAEDVDIGTSGSMTASTRNSYEVFLSFRGLDTRKGFADHLYNGLLDAGIDAFRDDDELHEGENIKPELLAAIMNSKILIPILSVNYGTSGWCLDELVQIMECKKYNGQIVLPIFYKVKPADVGHQLGSFGDGFHKREKRLLKRHFDLTILEKWKQALLEVSTLKGYEADGCEGKLVKSVVQKVLRELKKKFELVIPENLVGIDDHVEKVMKFVDDNPDASRFIGIHGMGGIGKTTLAKVIYNKLFDQFKYHSFIADIRESCERNGLTYLQNQLIFDILNKNNQASNKDDGIKFISSKFKDKKVLILLDDVDEDDQLKALVGNHDWFSPGSRILITTRNISVLENERVNFRYEHEVMDENHSMVLFSRHAFRRNSPPSEFEDLAHDAITTTGGLPLSLEVLGSLLCGKKLAFWRDAIAKSKKVPQKRVQKRLRISYEELDYRQKQIFLDIACFFIGADRRIISYMWDACGFFPEEGIEVLRFMSLIKIGDDHKFIMHDQLRDLGREMVREENQQEPHYRSRLWDSKEVLKVLMEDKGTNKIEAINLSGGLKAFHQIAGQVGNIYIEKQLKNLMRLRFLDLEGVYLTHLSGDFEDSMKELRWLRWEECPMNFEVNNFHVKELAVLELQYSEINEKWRGWSFFMMAEKLKFLDLSNCVSLENTDFLSSFKKLEVLILNLCRSLKLIDSSIGDMKALLRLELCWCESLTELPAEIGNLKALQQLLLERTRSLSALPDSIGFLENLEILDISVSGIEELPNGIGRLRKLQELRALGCENLKGIMAKSMCDFSSLRCLTFVGCIKLQSLPDLPSGLTNLGVTCRSRQLPSLSHLAHLKNLEVCNCEFLECIQVLPSTLLKNLECSQLTNVEESESPQSLNTSFHLEFLEVVGCNSIKTLDVSPFIHLKTLSTWDCENLYEVRGLDKLIYLEKLTVTSCNSIKWLDLPMSKGLKELEANFCEKLEEIRGLNRSEYLESLDIEGCTSIGRLDLPKSGRLKELKARGCKNLAEIQGLDRSEFLERLDISQCTSIGRLDLPKSGRLKELEAEGCKNLAEIQSLDSSEFLEGLNISKCTSIGRLDLPKSGSLEILYAKSCKKLAEIQGLESLEFLNISMCTSIETLLLSKSKSLKKLEAKECENLIEIQGLNGLEFLEELNIIGCKSLKTIPELSRTRIYRYYEITDGKTINSRLDYTDDSDESI